MDRAAAVRARLLHLLEPERHRATTRIDEVLGGAVAARLVPEHGAPERHHAGPIGRAGDDEKALDRRRIRGEAQLSGGRRDLARELDVTLEHPAVAFDERDHAHRHTVVTHVDVRLKVVDARQLADRLYEPGACRKRPSPEVRVRTVAQDAPLVDTL